MIAPLDESVVGSPWSQYARMEHSLMGVLEAPHGLPDVRGLRVVAHQNQSKGLELAERWIRNGPV